MMDETPAQPSPQNKKQSFTYREVVFILALICCLIPVVTPPLALLLGLIVANATGNPFRQLTQKATRILLQVSVVGLGFGMNVHSALSESKEGFLFTVVSILSTLALGTLIGRWMNIERKTSYLISSGTAICGGSAIAAISSVIKAEEKQISVALGTVFILNSIALFIFPAVGHWLELSQKQFGLWSAIAIHDTSSVVGAANKYGAEALQVATTVKLARALWIIPLTLLSTFLFKAGSKKIKLPYFIGFFVLAMVLNTYVPELSGIAPYIVTLSKTGLTVTLFLIGSSLNRDILKTVGVRPLIQSVILWLFISVLALYAVMQLV